MSDNIPFSVYEGFRTIDKCRLNTIIISNMVHQDKQTVISVFEVKDKVYLYF